MVNIPKTQTAATVPKLGGGVVFVHDYPVPQPGHNEVLAKVLYSGVCQSGKNEATYIKLYFRDSQTLDYNSKPYSVQISTLKLASPHQLREHQLRMSSYLMLEGMRVLGASLPWALE